MVFLRRFSGMAMAAALLAGTSAYAPAHADVKDGVDAWSRGDYAKAVAQWQKDAARGDADAQYNLGQAYRLGRGVPQDMKKAEELYAKAAAAGHPLAADNYGLLLFQQGRRAEAMPYLRDAVNRGDPRAQYLMGIAHVNGDLVEKDWVRAYALLTLANAQNLPQSAQAIGEMDGYIPLAQRQEAAALATRLQAEADATRAQQLAAADLAQGKGSATVPKGASTAHKDAQAAHNGKQEAPKGGKPVPAAPVDPSIAAAEAAVADAARVTGSESPATAGADYARPQVVASAAAVPPRAAPVAKPAAAQPQVPKPAVQKPAVSVAPPAPPRPAAPASAPAPSADGPWRVQLGAFSVAGNADQLWKKLGGKGVLAGKKKILLPSGKLTRLLAGGFASQKDADAACAALKRGGQSCIVTR